MKTRGANKLDNARTIMERFRLITLARYRDRSKIERASEEIDMIRAKSRGVYDRNYKEVERRPTCSSFLTHPL